MPTLPQNLIRALQALMLFVAGIFFALHAVHLAADFPNLSPWMDWSKYTDEGWYGDAAIRHFQRGRWYVPGDFNPAAALPAWPLLEALVFRFTGVSLLAARGLTVAVFGGILLASWALLRRWSVRAQLGAAASAHLLDSTLTPSLAVLLLAVSPFCFVFTRLAILEPLLVFFTLLALLAASAVALPETPAAASQRHLLATALRANIYPIAALGVLLPAMVLTKTTALFLMPAVAWLLFAAAAYRVVPFLRVAFPAAMLGASLWLTYFILLIRPHFLLDYRYLFSANAYTGIDRENVFSVLSDTFTDGMWIGPLLYPLALAAVLVALLHLRRLRASPLIVALLLWAFGYTAFLAYHANLQPRYYLVVAVPLTLLIPCVVSQLVLPYWKNTASYRLAVVSLAALFAIVIFTSARQTLHFVRHPEYTLVDAAREIHDYITADLQKDPRHNPLVLSISGSDLSLITGLPSICDDFGTLELDDRVKRYRPGWYVAWNQIDDDKMDAMTPFFHVQRVAAFPAMDDPDRNLMILYRLDPSLPTPPRHRRRKPTPHSLQTRVGQQPSTNQLEH